MIGLGHIRGQDRAIGRLRQMLATGKVPHALLFVGPAGVGKASTARALVRAMNCDTPGPDRDDGCGVCGPCLKIADDQHPDVGTVRPAGAGHIISIEVVRELGAKLAFAPHEARARVVIVEDADRLTDEASNAFLKTLEEPPARTHFILVSSAPQRLLITILSRCQRVGFVPLDVAAIAAILETHGVPAGNARAAAALAGGSAARATELGDSDVLERRRARLRTMVKAARGPGFAPIIAAAEELARAKEEVTPTLDLLASWYRDAAALAAGAPVEILSHTDDQAGLQAEVDAVTARRPAAVLARRATAVLDAQTALLGYSNPQLTLESLLVALRGVSP